MRSIYGLVDWPAGPSKTLWEGSSSPAEDLLAEIPISFARCGKWTFPPRLVLQYADFFFFFSQEIMDLSGVIGWTTPPEEEPQLAGQPPRPYQLRPLRHCKQVLKLVPWLKTASCALNLFWITFAQISG